jgi:riboflavin synthase alpha subunit
MIVQRPRLDLGVIDHGRIAMDGIRLAVSKLKHEKLQFFYR